MTTLRPAPGINPVCDNSVPGCRIDCSGQVWPGTGWCRGGYDQDRHAAWFIACVLKCSLVALVDQFDVCAPLFFLSIAQLISVIPPSVSVLIGK